MYVIIIHAYLHDYTTNHIASMCILIDISISQGWNQVSITNPDDPLIQLVIRVRPGSDPDVNQFK